jgi:hypothetical protein
MKSSKVFLCNLFRQLVMYHRLFNIPSEQILLELLYHN